MKTNNPIIDNLMDAQANAMNTWMDSAKKFQTSFSNGNIVGESQNAFKDMMEKQNSMFANMGLNTANPFMSAETKPEEFFKNWYTQQMGSAKQMADFNQSIYNSMLNFGKGANDYTNSFSTMNNAFTNTYNSFMGSMNSTYDTFSKNLSNPFNADMFKNMYEGSQMYMKAQEFFQPIMSAVKNNDFSVETWKNIYTTDNYKKMTEQVFSSFFNNANLKDVYDNGMKQVQHFFVDRNNLGKEYYAQMQNMSTNFPDMFSGNGDKLRELYANVNNVFGKTFEPLLKASNAGKEKETIEATIALMDKVAEYSIKQSELQAHLYKTMQTSMETLAAEAKEKYKDMKPGTFTMPTPNELYAEFIKTNEKMFSELFATDEFSKVKADALNLTMDVKKHFESQFENAFQAYPLTFKSEMEEVYQTMHDLKKQVKDLQTKLAMANAASVELFDEERAAKAKKK